VCTLIYHSKKHKKVLLSTFEMYKLFLYFLRDYARKPHTNENVFSKKLTVNRVRVCGMKACLLINIVRNHTHMLYIFLCHVGHYTRIQFVHNVTTTTLLQYVHTAYVVREGRHQFVLPGELCFIENFSILYL
jgi:hypothetical protein